MLDFFSLGVAHAGAVEDFIFKVNEFILNPLIRLLFAAAFIMFFWGVVEFIRGANNEKSLADGKRHMLWGVLGLVIMFSVWGLMQFIVDTLGLKGIDVETGSVELNDYNPKIK